MTIPLVIDGKAIGTVTFALAASGRHYTQADLAMAEELASHASLAIQNARLYWAVQQARDQLDIILRGVADGIVKHLKSQDETKHIPVIMFSAHPGAQQTAREAGAEDFVAKPFDIDELLGKVAQYL